MSKLNGWDKTRFDALNEAWWTMVNETKRQRFTKSGGSKIVRNLKKLGLSEDQIKELTA